MGPIREYLQCFVAEFIGTAFLVCTIKVSSAYAPSGFAPIAIGFVLISCILAYGYISGAHFNPCVTTGVLIRFWKGGEKVRKWLMYYVAQFCGGLFGGLMAWLIGGYDAAIIYPEFHNTDKTRQAFFAEFFYTFLLVSVVLHVATDHRQHYNSFYGLAIGGTVMMGAFTVGGISGGCFNTAVYVGAYTTAYAVDTSLNDPHWWLFMTAPLLGGIFAGFNYRFMFHELNADDNETDIHPGSPFEKKALMRQHEKLDEEEEEEIEQNDV